MERPPIRTSTSKVASKVPVKILYHIGSRVPTCMRKDHGCSLSGLTNPPLPTSGLAMLDFDDIMVRWTFGKMWINISCSLGCLQNLEVKRAQACWQYMRVMCKRFKWKTGSNVALQPEGVLSPSLHTGNRFPFWDKSRFLARTMNPKRYTRGFGPWFSGQAFWLHSGVVPKLGSHITFIEWGAAFVSAYWISLAAPETRSTSNQVEPLQRKYYESWVLISIELQFCFDTDLEKKQINL